MAPGEREEEKKKVSKENLLYAFAWEDDEISLEDLPRQAQVVADALYSTGKSKFTIEEIEQVVSAPEVVEKLNTKQPPMKIFAFYRTHYLRKGLMNLEPRR